MLKSGLEPAVVPNQGDRLAFGLDRPAKIAGLCIGGGQSVEIVFISPTSEAAGFGCIGYGLFAVALRAGAADGSEPGGVV